MSPYRYRPYAAKDLELIEANTEPSNLSARALFASKGYREVYSFLTYRRPA